MARTYTVLVDWNNDGDFSDAGEDVSARILALEWSRGRDYASQLTGRAAAGRASIRLDNRSGDYSSFKAASPLAGNLLPGRKVRIQADEGGFPYTFPFIFSNTPAWYGFLSAIKPEPSLYSAHAVTLEAIGPLGYLNQREVEVAMATNVLTNVAIGDILNAAGWPAGDRTIATGKTTMKRFWQDKALTLTALRAVEESEAGFLLEAKDGKVVFQDRQYRLSGAPLTPQATFSDTAGAALSYTKLEQLDPLPNIFNILESEVRLYSVGGLATLWTLAESGADSPKVERAGGTRTFWASYPNPDSSTDAFAVDAWTTPVATTDYLVNTAADGSGTNITSDIVVAVSKFGQAMKITLTNNNAADGYVTLLQARGTPVSGLDPVKVRQEDSPSQTKYGQRTWPNPARFIPDTQEAEDWALFHLGIYKEAIPLLSLAFPAHRNSAHFAEAMVRDIGDRITVVNANLGIDDDFFIEAEHHGVDAQLRHKVVWELSGAEKFSDFWVLDTSKLDTETRLAY